MRDRTNRGETSTTRFLANLAAIMLVLLAVAVVGYYLGRHGAIEYNLEYREPTTTGSPLTAELEQGFVAGVPIYVPAYSHIYVEDGQGTLLTVTHARGASGDLGIPGRRTRHGRGIRCELRGALAG